MVDGLATVPRDSRTRRLPVSRVPNKLGVIECCFAPQRCRSSEQVERLKRCGSVRPKRGGAPPTT